MLKKIIILFSIILFSGCGAIPPLEEWAKGGIGQPIDEIKVRMSRPESYASRIEWKETAYKLPNGNMVFIEPELYHFIHWEVDPHGIVIDYKLEKKQRGQEKPTTNPKWGKRKQYGPALEMCNN